MPILIAIGLKKRPENAEVDEFRSIFQTFGDDDMERVDKETVEMLKRFDNDQAVLIAEKEFKEAQEIQADFYKGNMAHLIRLAENRKRAHRSLQ